MGVNDICNGTSDVTVSRIHEFNVQPVMALFLPYHESPHFAKMITILQIK